MSYDQIYMVQDTALKVEVKGEGAYREAPTEKGVTSILHEHTRHEPELPLHITITAGWQMNESDLKYVAEKRSDTNPQSTYSFALHTSAISLAQAQSILFILLTRIPP